MRPRINHTAGAADLLGIIEHAHLRTDKPNIGGGPRATWATLGCYIQSKSIRWFVWKIRINVFLLWYTLKVSFKGSSGWKCYFGFIISWKKSLRYQMLLRRRKNCSFCIWTSNINLKIEERLIQFLGCKTRNSQKIDPVNVGTSFHRLLAADRSTSKISFLGNSFSEFL